MCSPAVLVGKKDAWYHDVLFEGKEDRSLNDSYQYSHEWPVALMIDKSGARAVFKPISIGRAQPLSAFREAPFPCAAPSGSERRCKRRKSSRASSSPDKGPNLVEQPASQYSTLSASPSEDELQRLWSTSYDAWIGFSSDVPIAYLAPMQENASSPVDKCRCPNGQHALPSVAQTACMFALTAWNPFGVAVAHHINVKANQALEARIERLMRNPVSGDPIPISYFKAFGFSNDWRENGFTVAFSLKDLELARQLMLSIAIEYEQAAIFEYRPAAPEANPYGNRVLRRTLAAAVPNVESETVMMEVACIQSEGIASPDWEPQN